MSACAGRRDLSGFRPERQARELEAKRALAEEIRANPVVTPDGRYSVIAIDPPLLSTADSLTLEVVGEGLRHHVTPVTAALYFT